MSDDHQSPEVRIFRITPPEGYLAELAARKAAQDERYGLIIAATIFVMIGEKTDKDVFLSVDFNGDTMSDEDLRLYEAAAACRAGEDAIIEYIVTGALPDSL